MIAIVLPKGKRLVWYLAAEEYLAQHIRSVDEPIFFTWVVAPTVIFGRHQVMANEVNMDYCRSNDIQMYRRKSGGGCVYADKGNLMLSYITPSTHSEKVFDEFLNMVSQTLQQCGFEAVTTANNDILIDGHKISGNACYALPTGTIVHGTMLYDVDFEMLQKAITPSAEKLAKHGVDSVRKRVINLRQLGKNGFDKIEKLSEYLTTHLCDKTVDLSEYDSKAIVEIETIEQTYLDPNFITDK